MTIDKDIKSIVFDLGGVLLNLDYSRTTTAFQKLVPNLGSFDAIYSRTSQTQLFENFEIGNISASEFRQGIRRIANKEITDDAIDKAWNAMLLDFPIKRLQMLEKLKLNYNLFLLSNTNEIHLAAYTKILASTFGFRNLSHIFEKEYYSHQLKMRKPTQEIFQFVLESNKLKAIETLFIDDSAEHVKTAQQLGLKTCWLEKENEITKILETNF